METKTTNPEKTTRSRRTPIVRISAAAALLAFAGTVAVATVRRGKNKES